jgi:ABC-type transport system substrate-binding protein
VPREAVEHYGPELSRRPVGSGPFQVIEFDTTRVVFEPNPKFREEPLDLEYEGYDEAEHGHLGIAALAGEPPPFIDRLEIDFISETASRWASFTSGREIQYTTVPAEQMPIVIATTNPITIEPEFDERYHMTFGPESGLVLTLFNMDDPSIGYNDDPERERRNHELRCAIRDGFSWDQRNERFYGDIGIIFPGVIPPAVPEHDPNMDRDSVTQNVERARRRLAAAGWTPENLPVIEYGGTASTTNREFYEQFRGFLTNIGYPQDKVEYRAFANFGDYSRAMRSRELMVMGYGWGLDYPDAENTLQLFYGPNQAPGSNAANYVNPEYDALYERTAVMQPSPERTELYARMNEMLIDDCVALMSLTRTRVYLWHKNVIGQPNREILGGFWLRFVDVADPAAN